MSCRRRRDLGKAAISSVSDGGSRESEREVQQFIEVGRGLLLVRRERLHEVDRRAEAVADFPRNDESVWAL